MSHEQEVIKHNKQFTHLRHISVTPAIKNRRSYLSNIWIFDSPKNGVRLTIEGDVAFMHVVLLEGNVEVERYDVNPPPVTAVVDGEVRQTKLDAVIYFRDSRQEWWEFKRATDAGPDRVGRAKPQLSAQAQAASAIGVHYRVRTERDLVANTILFDNWLLLCAAMNRVRGLTISNEVDVLDRRLTSHREVTLGSLLSEKECDPALMFALIAKMLQQGTLATNLNDELIRRDSLISRSVS